MLSEVLHAFSGRCPSRGDLVRDGEGEERVAADGLVNHHPDDAKHRGAAVVPLDLPRRAVGLGRRGARPPSGTTRPWKKRQPQAMQQADLKGARQVGYRFTVSNEI